MKIRELLVGVVLAGSLPIAAQSVKNSSGPINRSVGSISREVRAQEEATGGESTSRNPGNFEKQKHAGGAKQEIGSKWSWSAVKFQNKSAVPDVIGGQRMGPEPMMQKAATDKPPHRTGGLKVSSVGVPGVRGGAQAPQSPFTFTGKVQGTGSTRHSALHRDEEEKKFSAQISSGGGTTFHRKRRKK